jgi:hypothetical protein
LKQLLIAMVMVMMPVMAACGNNAPNSLRPSLDVRLAAEWRYADEREIFVSSSGEEFSPAAALPKGTQIRYMVPHLAKADRAALTADERNLAQYLQVVFPKGTSVDPYLAIIGEWPCVERVEPPPEVSLP